MEKIILRVEGEHINDLTRELQKKVFPAVSLITGKLIELGVINDLNHRVSEVLRGY